MGTQPINRPYFSNRTLSSFALLIFCLCSQGFTVAATPIVVELPMQGVTIETNPSGDWQRIFATGTQPVEFPDRRGISTAQKIAEQRAKAEIIKFFNQDVSAETVMSEMEQTSQTSSRVQGTQQGSLTKESTRRLATSLSETIKSYSRASLRGLVILESGYNEKTEEAWVKVGISRNSVAAANVQQSMQNSNQVQQDRAPTRNEQSQDGVKPMPSEIRRAPPLP
jgi:hypothetical protein